jgi:hypothetical protein
MILKKMGVRLWSGLDWLKIGSSGEFCEYCNELSDSIEGWIGLDQLSDYWFFRKDFVP